MCIYSFVFFVYICMCMYSSLLLLAPLVQPRMAGPALHPALKTGGAAFRHASPPAPAAAAAAAVAPQAVLRTCMGHSVGEFVGSRAFNVASRPIPTA